MSFIPSTDAGMISWLTNFAETVALDPLAYGISQEQSDELIGQVQDFVAAYDVATTPSTRTPVAVANKDAERNAAVALARLIVRIVNTNAALSKRLMCVAS